MEPRNSDIYNSAVEKVSFLVDGQGSQRERSTEMSHDVFDIFRDALINNGSNLQYIIITPYSPPYGVTGSKESKAWFPPRNGGSEWRPTRTCWELTAGGTNHLPRWVQPGAGGAWRPDHGGPGGPYPRGDFYLGGVDEL